jgi:2-dehydropantoate 2-reductase
MKIAIYGAGAIGSYLGVSLFRAGAEVTMIARGANLRAIRENGLTLLSGGERVTVHPKATNDPEEAGAQDCVFVALKAYAFAEAANPIAKLLGLKTALVTAMNGIPYWYFYGLDRHGHERRIEAADPGGHLWRTLPPSRAIGCVLYPWAAMVAPGIVEQSTSNRFILGEPDGSKSDRIEALSALMQAGGLDAPRSDDIRSELWGKLWGNLSLNPLSALTGATVDRLAFEPPLRAAARTMMEEARPVAEALGVRFPMDVERRLDIAGAAGTRKTSMLQDFERGRPLELDAILGTVVELADLTGHAVPLCRAVLALTRERAHNRPG